ncbi:MAG: hypothetical protein HY294_08525 [Candidatus Rokubacteria bacterium]|nr:hypothetical protein [Candidatus Rokubacteria bacterium]
MRTRPRGPGLLALGLILTYVVVVPPHLVHHIGEPGDAHHQQARCPHLALDDRATRAGAGAPALAALPSVVPAAPVAAPVRIAAPIRAPGDPRGPPPSLPS